MNTADKKQLQALRTTLDQVRADIEEMRDAEQEKFDEKSDKWKESPAGETEEARIASLSDAIDQLEVVDSNIETALNE
jgi:5'-deoxynucleotidase YfbR-like HD superfamily hydrolase